MQSCARYCGRAPTSSGIAAIFRRAWWSPNTSTWPMLSSTPRKPEWSMRCSTRSPGNIAPTSWRARGDNGPSAGRKRQGDRAAEIRRRVPRQRRRGEMVVGNTLEEALHCNLGDEPRHLAAETEMLAGPEAEMPVRAALDIVDVRVGELALVTIAGAEGEHHLVPDLEPLPVQLGLAHDDTLETLRRSVEAKRFLNRWRHQRGFCDNAAAGFRVVVQV